MMFSVMERLLNYWSRVLAVLLIFPIRQKVKLVGGGSVINRAYPV